MKVLFLLFLVVVGESCVPRYSSKPSCLCGVPLEKRRIIGGVDAKVNQYPWQVGLMLDTHPFCGGTLISSDTVLTAAHCLFSLVIMLDEPTLFLYVAIPRGGVTLEKAEKIRPSKILVHPYFHYESRDNDFAIIKLSRPVQFDDSIQPICLPNPTDSYDDNFAVVVGWGFISYQINTANTTDTLQTLNVTTMTNQECQNKLTGYIQSTGDDNFPKKITSSMICAAHDSDPARSPCFGDSGGPLLTLNKEGSYYSQIGVVSWGDAMCGGQSIPGVFGRVTNQLYWIMKQVTGKTCQPPTR